MKLRPVSGKDVVTSSLLVLRRCDKKAATLFLRHPDGRTTVVPVHANEEIGPGLLGKITKDAELTREDFVSLLR